MRRGGDGDVDENLCVCGHIFKKYNRNDTTKFREKFKTNKNTFESTIIVNDSSDCILNFFLFATCHNQILDFHDLIYHK